MSQCDPDNRQLELFPDEGSKAPFQEQPAAPPTHAPTDANAQPEELSQRQARLLHQELTLRSGMTLHLTITNNKRTMMSVRHGQHSRSAWVRLHRIFLAAPEEIQQAVAHWIKHPRSKQHTALFKSFFAAHETDDRPSPPRRRIPVTRGKCYNLSEIFNELNQQYFDGAVQATITWGRDHTKRTRSIRFGSYCQQDRLIRIHPRLDQSFVPPFLVRSVVYHEMLHAHLGIQTGKHGRRKIHPPEFKKCEEAFPEHAQATAWIKDKDNMKRILRGQQ